MNKKIYFAGPSIDKLDVQFVTRAVKQDWYDNMSRSQQGLVQQVKKYINVKYVIPTMCCTHALHLACITLGFKQGDEVILPNHSWCATAHSIKYTGATCVFVDIDPKTLCIDVNKIQSAITDKTKGIMVVHNFGIPAQMDKIMKIARKYNLKVIQDAAPALGSKYKDKYVGIIGDIGCFSFQGGKLTVCNEGGLFITNNQEYYKKAILMATMGRTDREFIFWSDYLGYKYILGNLTASLAWSQVKRVDQLIAMKRQIHQWYYQRIQNDKRFTMVIANQGDYANYCYPSIWINEYENSKNAVQVLQKLQKNNIYCRNGFPQIDTFPMYEKRFQTPVCKSFMYNGLVLPSALNMTQGDADIIINKIKGFV